MLFRNIACCNAAKRQWKSRIYSNGPITIGSTSGVTWRSFSKGGWLGDENCCITVQPTN